MLSLSISELIVIAIIAVVMIRPEDIPELVRFGATLYRHYQRSVQTLHTLWQKLHIHDQS